MIFTLHGATDDRFDKQKWQVIKRFASEVICDEFKEMQLKSTKHVYRKMTLEFFNQNGGASIPFKKLCA